MNGGALGNTNSLVGERPHNHAEPSITGGEPERQDTKCFQMALPHQWSDRKRRGSGRHG